MVAPGAAARLRARQRGRVAARSAGAPPRVRRAHVAAAAAGGGGRERAGAALQERLPAPAPVAVRTQSAVEWSAPDGRAPGSVLLPFGPRDQRLRRRDGGRPRRRAQRGRVLGARARRRGRPPGTGATLSERRSGGRLPRQRGGLGL